MLSFVQAQRANDISDSSYRLRQALAPNVNVYANDIDGSLTEVDGKLAIRMQVELVNLGQVHLSGCSTFTEASDEAGKPTIYWPSVMGMCRVTWDVDAGAKYSSDVTVPLSSLVVPGDTNARTAYVAIWYECESAHLVSQGFLYGIDLNAQSLIAPKGYVGTDIRGPIRSLRPLGSYERYVAIEQAYGRTPGPRPAPTPQFTTDPSTKR